MRKVITNPDGSRTRISKLSGKKFTYKNYGNGGKVNTLEGDLISKVVMNRNQSKDFVQRAYALGEIPDTPMFVKQDGFDSKASHKMAWGTDNTGQAWMYPTIYNPNNEAVKVPNQYADYISSQGYKKATGMSYKGGGTTKVEPIEGLNPIQDKTGNITGTGKTDYAPFNIEDFMTLGSSAFLRGKGLGMIKSSADDAYKAFSKGMRVPGKERINDILDVLKDQFERQGNKVIKASNTLMNYGNMNLSGKMENQFYGGRIRKSNRW